MNTEELKSARRNLAKGNRDLAYQIYNDEINKGDTYAMFDLARTMIEKKDNIEFAINLMIKSSDLENMRATEYLAYMYRDEQDYVKSFEYFKKLYYNGSFSKILELYNIASITNNEDLCTSYIEMYKDLQSRDVDMYELSGINENLKPIMKMKSVPVLSTDDKCYACKEKLFCTYKNVKILTCGHMFHEMCRIGTECTDESCYL